MRYLHKPLMQQGVDVWWVDGGSGDVDMPGLNKQLWTNKVFYDYTQQQTGQRGFILGRYGDWGSERYPGFFTGDTYSSGRCSPTRSPSRPRRQRAGALHQP
jgi:alpha-glucosidase (family GH31 glycosyl hydrolase)